jgi:hypothetical protein
MQGYLHPAYAQSFSEIGDPLFLPKSKGWLIKRQIPNTEFFDAMGPYPLFLCKNWDLLLSDLELLKNELICVSLVIPPLTSFPDSFCQQFDICRPYKDHYLLDLSIPLNKTISKSRRKDVRKVSKNLRVELDKPPNINLDEWTFLYSNLVRRHKITGIRSFSEFSFKKQISIPETHFFRVTIDGILIGGNLFFTQGDIVYAHLSAFTDEGYDLGAPYVVKWVAINYFFEHFKWINFGGSTSNNQKNTTGLDIFKKGWSSQTMPSFFCGKILNKNKYYEIMKNTPNSNEKWFPAYRYGEFD